ncbi:MAG: competence/damage-inducible protein A, partial [Firmicutes bacterium]|nr:competence/damage-inducible protein A [Bacillota bacterium]
MRATVLTVGTEILFGSIVNTNAAYLSQQLQLLGIDVMYHHTVGDNDKRLADVIALCFKDCDLIVTTGGLGPTEDDLTKETVAASLGDTLVLHEPSLEAMKKRMEMYGRKMTPNNLKQAYLPSTATPFPNACGTAPGFALEREGKIIMCFPG